MPSYSTIPCTYIHTSNTLIYTSYVGIDIDSNLPYKGNIASFHALFPAFQCHIYAEKQPNNYGMKIRKPGDKAAVIVLGNAYISLIPRPSQLFSVTRKIAGGRIGI